MLEHKTLEDACGPAPAVSVVLATFNRLKYLPPAIESVFAQTFQDWELIIADDGSDEETKAYLRKLDRPPRVKVIWLAHSGNPGVVRNAALREARGEYIAFLDSDDIWLPGKLSAQIASLRSQPEFGWSHTGFMPVDASANTLTGKRGVRWPVAKGWILERLIKMDAVIALPSVVVRRQLMAQVGGFDTSLCMCEDYDLWVRLAAQSAADAVPELLLLIRRHGEHIGDDATAFVERGRVLEKMLGSGTDRSFDALLRRERSKVAAGLARSHAVYGSRRAALRALLHSPPDAWRYREWWLGAGEATARALTPEAVLRVIRRFRHSRAGSTCGV